MDPEVRALASKITALHSTLPPSARLLVAIAGPPGSGKSTLAYPLTELVNALVLGRPVHPLAVDEGTGLMHATPDSGAGPGAGQEGTGQKGAADVAVCVGQDGWHLLRRELDEFVDPAEAHWRRGAAFTFDLPSYLSFVQQLRLPLDGPNPPRAIPYPTFDHALKDPRPSPVPITPRHRVIIVEGLYTMLDRPGWRECAEMFDLRVWVDVDREVARRRVIRRNYEAGIVDDLVKCEERVDAVDMVNGDEVRTHRVAPTDTVNSSDRPLP